MSLRDIIASSSQSRPIDAVALASYVLPALACFLAVAVLALTPNTYTIRVALWPVVAFLALRAAVSLDVSQGRPEFKLLDGSFTVTMFYIVIRALDWTLTRGPLVRHLRPKNNAPSTILDAIDLTLNLRGYGWNWSHGTYFPPQTRPTSHGAFVFHTFLSMITNAILCGICHRAVLSFAVGYVGQPWTVLDNTLPFSLRYLRSSIILVLLAFTTYNSLQTWYALGSILAVVFLGHDPALWPPAFDAPWLSTSLHDFWGRRWHQWCRHLFLFLGGYPFSIFLGDAGIVLGAFVVSAVLHDIILVKLDNRLGPWWMLVGFGMNGPGLLIERAFRQITGNRVGGVWGWIWTMSWLLVFGGVMLEGFARTGAFADWTLIDFFVPLRALVERVVMGFDDWLHTM